MKKSGLILLFLLIPFVSAISTDMKETYQPGETMIIEITGNILSPIAPEDIELKRNNVQVPFVYDVKRLADKYFLYGILPQNENNYTLYIHDLSTTENGATEEIDFNQSFQIAGNLTAYSINPGFISAEDEAEAEFKIFLNRDVPEEITIDLPSEWTFVLQPGENTITIPLGEIPGGLNFINIGTYRVPVLVENSREVDSTDIGYIAFYPRNIQRTVLKGDAVSYPFRITNEGDEDREITIEYDDDIFRIQPETPKIIPAGEDAEFTLEVIHGDVDIDKIITVNSGDEAYEFEVDITYTENESDIINPSLNNSGNSGYYCSELGGNVCAGEESCNGEVLPSIDAPSCCIGTCVQAEKTSYSWIGYLIAAVVLIILVVVGGRYMKTRNNKVNPLSKISS